MFEYIKDIYWDFKPSDTEKTVCIIGMIAVGISVAWIVG